MRVVGGTAGGRRLRAPGGKDVRPTSDRAREALFSAIAAEVPGAVVLDLFAGSGALAIEALSRGAGRAVLVERDQRALEAIEANLAHAGVAGRARVLPWDAERFSRTPRGGPFTLVLVDPPYRQPMASVHALLERLRDRGALAPGALIVVERDRRDPGLDDPLPAWLAPERARTYGDTALVHWRVGGQDAHDDPATNKESGR